MDCLPTLRTLYISMVRCKFYDNNYHGVAGLYDPRIDETDTAVYWYDQNAYLNNMPAIRSKSNDNECD